MNACFIGHRTIEKTNELIVSLKEIIVTLINNGVATFLFGSKSAFDNLSWEIITELKKKYPFIKRVYVRSDFPRISKAYEEYLLKSYEDTYFPSKIENVGKCSYIKRNYEMIDNSTYCVFYYNENYIPTPKSPTKSNLSSQKKRNSGTKIAYEYALKEKKEIFNLYNPPLF